MDTAMNIVVEPRYASTGNFSEGLARVETKKYQIFDETIEKYGYIDPKGNIIITPQFNYAYSFNHNRVQVRVNDKFGYINRKGEFIWNPTN
jgi:hypothetical protein